MIDLDAIEARANAATPGPWRARCRDCHNRQNNPAFDSPIGLGWEIYGPPEPDLRGQYARGADADFVAAAREDIPALVAEVRRLRAVVAEAYRDQCGCLGSCIDAEEPPA